MTGKTYDNVGEVVEEVKRFLRETSSDDYYSSSNCDRRGYLYYHMERRFICE